jgi:RND family efflux transporter MFP subunit
VSRTLKIVLAIVALVLVLGVIAFFVVRARSAGPQIDTATASKRTLGVSVSASGQIAQGLHADIYPPAAGTLSAVYVKNGQVVKAGQKIAQMDTGPLKIQVQQAKAGLAQANAQVDAANQQTPSGADIAAAKANVTATSAAYSAAKTVYDNSVKAYNGAKAAAEASPTPASQAALLQASTAKAQADAGVDQAYAAYKGAQAQLSKLQNTSTTASRSAAEAAAAQARQALAVAEATLAAATMEAPFDGVVIFNPTGVSSGSGAAPVAAAGAGVSPQFAPFTVVDLGASVFTAQVDEADVSRVAIGKAAKVTLDAYPGKEFSSKVVNIGKASQPTATGGTIFPVDLEMVDSGVELLLGMKGDASIEVSAVSEAVVIPVEALFNESGKNYVYLVENGRLKKQEVSVGATTETDVQVLKGVEPGQVVALSGPTQYTDGMAVRVNP